MTVLTDILGSEVEAIKAASRILRVSGTVLPVTTANTHLEATYADGSVLRGEHTLEEYTGAVRIKNLTLTNPAQIYDEAALALKQADCIVLGPGDLYTSVLANCIVSGFTEAIQASSATIVYVCNLMSRPGQTTGLGSAEHLAEIVKYAGVVPDYLLINNDTFPSDLLEKYAREGTYPVQNTGASETKTKVLQAPLLAREIIKTIEGDVLERSLIRHDGVALASVILSLLK